MKQPHRQHINQNPSVAQLFISFLKLGATAFGGPAMVAYIRKMAVEQKRWLSERSFHDGVALCQTIPGATAMQTAAYVGLRARGVLGALASFIGFGLPAFLIMMILSASYVHAQSLPTVVSALNGLRIIIVAIVANATLSFGRNFLKSWRGVIVTVFAAGMFGLGVHPILVILLAALLGFVLDNRQFRPHLPVGSGRQGRTIKPLLLLLSVTVTGLVLLFLLKRELFDLAVLMFRIDLFAFGGGFASLPLMLHEFVRVRSWIDSRTFLNGIALGQITPGPIVITATFVGYLLHGPLGGLIASISIFLPSFLLVVGITPYFDKLRGSLYFNKAVNGILYSFVGLLFMVTIRFALNIPWDFPRLLLLIAAFIALLLKVDILWVVLVGIVISVLVF